MNLYGFVSGLESYIYGLVLTVVIGRYRAVYADFGLGGQFVSSGGIAAYYLRHVRG